MGALLVAHEPQPDSASDDGRLLPGAVVCGLGVRWDVRCVLYVQRFMCGDRRKFLSQYLRHGRVRVLHDVDRPDRTAEPGPDRDNAADTRDAQAMRALLPRPHASADTGAFSAAHHSGSVRNADNTGSVWNTDACSFCRPNFDPVPTSDFWPIGRAIPPNVASFPNECASCRAVASPKFCRAVAISEFAAGSVADDA